MRTTNSYDHLALMGELAWTRISNRMQKHKFSVMYLGMFIMETASGPPEHVKYCVDVSCPRRTRMPYVNSRSHQMQKHKFGVTCPDVLFMETTSGP
jgi:hypothetical protein